MDFITILINVLVLFFCFSLLAQAQNLNASKKALTEYDLLSNENERHLNYKFLQELYQATRKVDAKQDALLTWLNKLDQGGSREGIYQVLVLDEVYSALEI